MADLNIEAKRTKMLSGKDVLRKYGILLALGILMIVMSCATDRFMTETNMINILVQCTINSILAIAVTYVILTGGIDLSPGSVIAISGVAFALFAQADSSGTPVYPMIVPVLAAIGTGTVFGFINGILVSRAKVAPFITTLGTMTIARGLALILAGGRPVSDMAQQWKDFGKGSFGPIPYLVIIMIIVAVVSIFILSQTKYGRYIYAIGGNEEASRASGISVKNIKLSVYVLASALVGLAGILQSARITVGQPNIGSGYELQAISAVVIGGTSLSGGVGTMWGTLVGAFIIGVLNNGLDLLGVSSYWQQVISGIIIIGAVLLDRGDKK